MKKLALCLLGSGLLFSLPSFAYSADCCPPVQCCAPKLPGGYYIGITGFYLQPVETNLGQANFSLQFVDTPIGGFPPHLTPELKERAEDQSIDPKYHWAGKLTLGYDFPCTYNNIEANYFHFNSNDSKFITTRDGNPITYSNYFFTNEFFPVNQTTGFTLTSLDSHLQLHYKIDQADVRVGHQFVNFCGPFRLRAAIGASYADLEHRLSYRSEIALQNFPILPAIFTGNSQTRIKSDFQGVGPLMAFDLHYGLSSCIGIVGHLNSALLIGKIRSNASIVNSLHVVAPPIPEHNHVIQNAFNRPRLTNVVPYLDAKLGIEYTYCFCNKSSLSVEAGYQANEYWHAFNLIRGDVTLGEEGPFVQRPTGIETDSLAIQGPYISLTWHV